LRSSNGNDCGAICFSFRFDFYLNKNKKNAKGAKVHSNAKGGFKLTRPSDRETL